MKTQIITPIEFKKAMRKYYFFHSLLIFGWWGMPLLFYISWLGNQEKHYLTVPDMMLSSIGSYLIFYFYVSFIVKTDLILSFSKKIIKKEVRMIQMLKKLKNKKEVSGKNSERIYNEIINTSLMNIKHIILLVKYYFPKAWEEASFQTLEIDESMNNWPAEVENI